MGAYANDVGFAGGGLQFSPTANSVHEEESGPRAAFNEEHLALSREKEALANSRSGKAAGAAVVAKVNEGAPGTQMTPGSNPLERLGQTADPGRPLLPLPPQPAPSSLDGSPLSRAADPSSDPWNYNDLPPSDYGTRVHSAQGQWEALKAQGRRQQNEILDNVETIVAPWVVPDYLPPSSATTKAKAYAAKVVK